MNAFRQLLQSSGSQPPIGSWVSSASPIVAEAMGLAGFDWGVVDMEHSPMDIMQVVHLLQAVGNTKMVSVVRVPWNDAVVVKRVLDAGAHPVSTLAASSADLARTQFGMTSIYHFLFVPLTLGLAPLVAVMQTIWYRSGDMADRKSTRLNSSH